MDPTTGIPWNIDQLICGVQKCRRSDLYFETPDPQSDHQSHEVPLGVTFQIDLGTIFLVHPLRSFPETLVPDRINSGMSRVDLGISNLFTVVPTNRSKVSYVVLRHFLVSRTQNPLRNDSV